MKKYMHILGQFLLSLRYLLNKKTRIIFNKSVHEIFTVATDRAVDRKKYLIILIGYTCTGKSYIKKRISTLSLGYQVESAEIHKVLNQDFVYLQDGFEPSGKAYWLRQFLTLWVRCCVFWRLRSSSYSSVSDSANLSLIVRLVMKWVFEPKKTIICEVVCDEVTRKNRAAMLDAKAGKAYYLPLLNKQEKRGYKVRTFEGDLYVVYLNNNQLPCIAYQRGDRSLYDELFGSL